MEIVKFFHFFGLMLGAGAGLGGMAAAIAHKRLGGGPPSDTIKAIKPIFGIFALSGIRILWITGLILAQNVDPALLTGLFYIKMLAAATMLAISVFLTIIAKKSTKAGVPPPSYFEAIDRKSTRLNSSHVVISYAVFCLKKKKK